MLRDYGFDSADLWTGIKNIPTQFKDFIQREREKNPTKHCKIKPCYVPSLEWMGFYMTEAWKGLPLEIH